MRHVPKFSDDYGLAPTDLAEAAILSADMDEMLDAIGDDWSLEDAQELDLLGNL
ncbi:hypothetical protein T8K17_16150 [Thalassobaculum sp. OXR-137]|uniref:hypothetical protein n=1 Tax=Thalassobaculum sp. OXR-137 TaxID=3100173 RepID=UPI002AC99F0F|nr:hypothetical protein [Thalassobaculum sp. OXR-137]WPZ32772.1 hypothetical protein T8K17_16150 [Thalassobaculum sp. OXR-137]